MTFNVKVIVRGMLAVPRVPLGPTEAVSPLPPPLTPTRRFERFTLNPGARNDLRKPNPIVVLPPLADGHNGSARPAKLPPTDEERVQLFNTCSPMPERTASMGRRRSITLIIVRLCSEGRLLLRDKAREIAASLQAGLYFRPEPDRQSTPPQD